MLVIGSHALVELTGQAELGRTPQDLDIIGSWDELLLLQQGANIAYPVSKKKWFLKFDPVSWSPAGIVEFEIAWPGSLEEELNLHCNTLPGPIFIRKFPGISQKNVGMKIGGADILYTLKMSHRYLKNSSHFQKTRKDIEILRQQGAQIWDQKWFEAREKETYNYGSPRLSQGKEEFFSDDGIDYRYDHDDLHKAVMVGTKPAYTKYQVDGEEVLSSQKKFNDLPHITRLTGVYEEAAVLALERSVIPHQAPPEKAFMIALEKVCTSITSGWFREFAWENYDQVVLFYKSVGEEYYHESFQNALAEGTIKPQK